MTVRRRVLAMVGASLIALALPPAAAIAADPALLAQGAEAVDICARHMPDIRDTKAALAEAGFRLDESTGTLHAYTRTGFRVVVGVTTPSAQNPACVVLVSHMTPAEARRLMQPWIRAAHAVPARDARRAYSHVHAGRLNGHPVLLGVIDHMELKSVRGAAVIAAGLDER